MEGFEIANFHHIGLNLPLMSMSYVSGPSSSANVANKAEALLLRSHLFTSGLQGPVARMLET